MYCWYFPLICNLSGVKLKVKVMYPSSVCEGKSQIYRNMCGTTFYISLKGIINFWLFFTMGHGHCIIFVKNCLFIATSTLVCTKYNFVTLGLSSCGLALCWVSLMHDILFEIKVMRLMSRSYCGPMYHINNFHNNQLLKNTLLLFRRFVNHPYILFINYVKLWAIWGKGHVPHQRIRMFRSNWSNGFIFIYYISKLYIFNCETY